MCDVSNKFSVLQYKLARGVELPVGVAKIHIFATLRNHTISKKKANNIIKCALNCSISIENFIEHSAGRGSPIHGEPLAIC